MKVMSHAMNSKSQATERAAQWEQCHREELVERLASAIPTDGRSEPLQGLHLFRFANPTEPLHGVAEPSLCIIAQGRKEVYLGAECYPYDPYSYLLATLELPVVGRVVEASPEQPYLALRLALDPAVVGSVLVEIGQMAPRLQGDVKALVVNPLDAKLLETVVRLVRLLDCPTEARLLLPLVTREIVYRLLVGAQGHRLRQMTVLDGHTHRVARAITRIRQDFAQLLYVEDLARQVGLSVSSFHYHFKEVTAMSPLQFQKQLRLQEARRLMLGTHLDAAQAGYHVGYEDASHFNRDYKRLFGVPPLRDVERLRAAAEVGANI